MSSPERSGLMKWKTWEGEKDFVVCTISMFYVFYQPIASYQQDINGLEQVALVSQWAEYTSSNSINKWNLTNVKCYKENTVRMLVQEVYNKSIFLWQGSQWSSGRCYCSFPTSFPTPQHTSHPTWLSPLHYMLIAGHCKHLRFPPKGFLSACMWGTQEARNL